MKKTVKAVICAVMACGFVLSTAACDIQGGLGGIIDDPMGTIGGIFNPNDEPDNGGEQKPGGENQDNNGQTGGHSYNVLLMFDTDADQDGVEDNMNFRVTVGGQYALPTPNKTPTMAGYDFKGWYKESDKGDFDTKVEQTGVWNASDVVRLKAKWEVKTYTLKFVSDGTVACPADVTVQYLQELDLTKVQNRIPTRVGYRFCGWALGIDSATLYFETPTVWNYVDEYDNASDDVITLKAYWKVIEYTIAYTYTQGTVKETYNTKFTVETLANVTLWELELSGYDFVGWSIDGKTVIKEITEEMLVGLEYVDQGDKCAATIALKAVWTEEAEENWTANY